MKHSIPAIGLLLGAVLSASPSHGHGGRYCRAYVLQSEEFAWAPSDHNRVRAVLEITPPDGPPFQATVDRLLPWQQPPPRQGQRFRLLCDAVERGSIAFTH